MAQDVLRIDRDGGRVGTDVNQGTARTALLLSQHGIGQRQRGIENLGNGNACRLKALIEILVESLALQDIQVVTLQVGTLDADGVLLILRVNLVLLYSSIENLLISVVHRAISVDKLVDHRFSDNRTSRQVPRDDITHTTDRLAAHAHIDLHNLLF